MKKQINKIFTLFTVLLFGFGQMWAYTYNHATSVPEWTVNFNAWSGESDASTKTEATVHNPRLYWNSTKWDNLGSAQDLAFDGDGFYYIYQPGTARQLPTGTALDNLCFVVAAAQADYLKYGATSTTISSPATSINGLVSNSSTTNNVGYIFHMPRAGYVRVLMGTDSNSDPTGTANDSWKNISLTGATTGTVAVTYLASGSTYDVKTRTSATTFSTTTYTSAGKKLKSVEFAVNAGTTNMVVNPAKLSNNSGTARKMYIYAVEVYMEAATDYTITYDNNGGSGTMANSTNTVSACTFGAPSSSQEFKEWNTQADGLGDSYDPGDAATSDLDLFAIWQTKVEKFTVKYMDGTTELGSEIVEVGQHPTGSSITTPTKECYTFAGWSPALSGVSGTDGQVVNVSATWTPVYASSFNFGTTTDLTKDNIATKLAASNIFCSVGTGGSYDAGGTTGYLGYKFKNNGDYVTFIVQNGYEATVTYGYTESGWQVNGADAGVTVKTQAYVDKKYKAEGSDLLLKLINQSANNKTSVLTNIVIKVIAAGDDDATLSDLSVSGYTLSPAFASATEEYTITKEYGADDPAVSAVTATPSVTGANAEVTWDGTNHKFVITVTAKDNVTTKTYNITINEAEAKRGLLTVPFSNGAKGAINAAGLEIRVPYIGASEPTVVLANIEYQSGVSGASASMESDKLRITGADSNYDDYTLTFVQLTPSALTLNEEVTFDAVPSYAFAPYGWDSGKGVKFAKKVEDGTPRISSGNTRVYFAIQDCDEVQLTSGSGGAKNVNIYVNGVLSSVDKTAASGSAIKLALDNTQANFIAIESNQTGGDGGFTKILVKALAANTLAYDNGAYTTGDPALDLSTLISTYNSDAAITYAVKTDGGTNASISGNNFTATVAGTAVVTATQVASETIRQASVDFNVVVTAGATKYTVTFDSQGGSAVDPQQVTEGGSPVEPTAPTKDEYIFKGWAESAGASVSDVVDVTSFTINAPKIFYAVWEAEPAGIKLLNGDGSINTTNFTTGVTASTVNFDDADHNCAVFESTGGSIVGLTGLNKVVAYNATTTQTKVKFVLYNTNSSAKELYLQKVLEGATEAVTETISVPSKERYPTLYYTYNSSDLRSFYVTTNSTDVKILQMKVIEDGTLLKRAGEAGYEVNLNQGRVLGAQNVAATFEGFAFTPSSNAKVLNSSELQIKTPLSFTIAAPLTLTVTTSSAKYYVSQNSAEDGTTATAVTAAGEETFDLAVAGTWYIVPSTTSAVKLTNIAFALPKCEEPTITTQPATKQTFDPGDLTATVVAEVSDGGTLSYQWYNASDDSEVSGADEATLTTTTEGTYYVIVTNSKAGFQDNSVKSDEATLAYRDATDATLSALNVSAGTLDPAFDPAVLEYDVYLPEGTVDVPTLTATATMAGYADVVVFNESSFTNYEATSTVTVTSEDHSESNVYIVRFHVDHAIAVLVDVTDDITWDFSKANDGSAATSNLCNEEIFANVAGIVNNGDFESDNLIVTANKFSSGKLQASMIKFHTTVPGIVKVVFSNTGSKSSERYLVVNGVKTASGSKNTTAVTYYGFVPAGDVVLTVVEGDGNMLNFTSVKFTKKAAADYARDAAHGDDWMAPGELGTICLEHGAVATGGDIFELVGKNDDGKIVFASVSHMTPGKPYLFQAKSNAMNFYYTDEAEVSEPDNSGAMKGSFTNYTLNNVANVYYFAGHALWLVDADHLDVIAHRAYVQMDEVGSASAPMPGRRYFAMNVNGHNTPTGLENGGLLNGENGVQKVLINGNLYILRGEKMFDATGRLVK